MPASSLRPILALAMKDLRVLSRVRAALFFAVGWPLCVAIFFGLIFGGGAEDPADLPVALVDEDGSPASGAFVAALEARDGLRTRRMPRHDAEGAVRKGAVTAAIVLPPGFGAASERLFFGDPPEVDLLVDPSRKAEAGLLEGLLVQQGARRFEGALRRPAPGAQTPLQKQLAAWRALPPGTLAEPGLERFLAELDLYLGRPPDPAAAADESAGGGTGGAAGDGASLEPLRVRRIDLVRSGRRGPASSYAITFPQGLLWACIGSAMSFAVGLVTERTQGTFVRLRSAPLPASRLLAGKALACALGLLAVQSLVLAVGIAFFRVRPDSPALLAGSLAAVTLAFVGLAMLVASLGKTEQAASGAGWALLMPLAMLGGAMIPLIAMPGWMVRLSHVSPIKWALLAYEGTIWRDFGLAEMVLPWSILAALGVVGFLVGSRILRRTLAE